MALEEFFQALTSAIATTETLAAEDTTASADVLSLISQIDPDELTKRP